MADHIQLAVFVLTALLLPVFAQDILQVGERGFGLLRASPAIGAGAMSVLFFLPVCLFFQETSPAANAAEERLSPSDPQCSHAERHKLARDQNDLFERE